jgi:hypothetical protein
MKTQSKKLWEEDSSDEDKILVVKKINNLNKTIPVVDSFTEKFKSESRTNYTHELIENNYDLIPSSALEDLTALRSHYSTLFVKDTPIQFRVYELSLTSGGISPSAMRSGTISEFVEDSKSFLIKLKSSEESEDNILENFGTDIELGIINVSLKDFIELWILKSELNKPIPNTQIEKTESLQKDLPANKTISEDNNKNNHVATPRLNQFQKIILPQIKKQIEYYFSDKNYYKDTFLQEKAGLNSQNCKLNFNLVIDMKIFIGFNKIKSLTDNISDIALAMKDSNMVEMNDDGTMLRKKQIIKEFIITN